MRTGRQPGNSSVAPRAPPGAARWWRGTQPWRAKHPRRVQSGLHQRRGGGRPELRQAPGKRRRHRQATSAPGTASRWVPRGLGPSAWPSARPSARLCKRSSRSNGSSSGPVPTAAPSVRRNAVMVHDDTSRFSGRWISWAVQLGKMRCESCQAGAPARGPARRGLLGHLDPHLREAPRFGRASLPRRTSVVLSTSSTTSGRVSLPTSILAPSGRVARGCRYTVWSASRMRRQAPSASRSRRSAADDRRAAHQIRVVRPMRRCPGSSW